MFVFLLNGFLFDISYFPDQNRYLMVTDAIRENLGFLNYWEYDRNKFGAVTNSSLLFSLSPMLFVESVYSLALVNTMLYSLLFIFLYKKGYLNNYAGIFYLFFPSLALYSGIGLRDTWILFFMVLSIYYFINGKGIVSFLLALPLLFIKYQNFAVYIISVVVYKILMFGKQSLINVIIKITLLILLFQLLINIIGIEFLDFYRAAFYAEDGGKIENYIPLDGAFDVLIKSTIGAFTFMLRPFPWEVNGAFQLIQSFENILIFFIIAILVKKQFEIKNERVWFLLVFLFIGMSLYGLIIFNFGTAIRYRYTFVVIFIVFSYTLLYMKKNKYK